MQGAGNWSTATVPGQAGGHRKTYCYSASCMAVTAGESPRCPYCGGQVRWK